MCDVALICVGTLLLISGLVAAWKQNALSNALSASSHRPQLMGIRAVGDVVQLAGTVAAPEGATLLTPCGGESAVWVRLRLRTYVPSGGGEAGAGGLWVTVADASASVPFSIVTSSGERVRLVPERYDFRAKMKTYSRLPVDAQERVHQFLNGRGMAVVRADAYEEEALKIGDTVTAVGLLQSSNEPSIAIGYRDSDHAETDLVSPPGTDLLVVTYEILKRARLRATLSRVAVMGGVVLLFVGLLCRLML